jgi:hypothetical protein
MCHTVLENFNTIRLSSTIRVDIKLLLESAEKCLVTLRYIMLCNAHWDYVCVSSGHKDTVRVCGKMFGYIMLCQARQDTFGL